MSHSLTANVTVFEDSLSESAKSFFQLGPYKMAPTKKGGKKKCHSAISNVVRRKYTIFIHKHIHAVGFKKRAPWALREIWKFVMKVMGTPVVCIDIRLSKAVWAKGIRNIPYHIHMR